MAEINKKVLGFSSVLSTIVSSFIVVYCTLMGKNAPTIAEIYVLCTAGLLGLDEIVKKYLIYKIEKTKQDTKQDDKIEN